MERKKKQKIVQEIRSKKAQNGILVKLGTENMEIRVRKEPDDYGLPPTPKM